MNLRCAAVVAALTSLLSGPAFSRDARLVTRLYNPDQIVLIEGRPGVQATISFAEDEHIENVAIGDSNTWQVTPNKRANILFVKPLSPRGRTNLTVVTDQRTYLFDLVSGTVATPLYVLRFTYPAVPKAPAKLATGISNEEADAIASPPRETTSPDLSRLNFAWRSHGSARVLPTRIYDDGTATFLSWDDRSQLPAILTRNEKGEEGAVNYAVRGGVIVVDGVPRLIILRSGKNMATLENQGRASLAALTPANAAANPAAAVTPSPVSGSALPPEAPKPEGH